MDIVEEARAFATQMHAGQTRKYTGEPYINHPAEVATIVANVGGSYDMIAAAWLHDVVEDCGVALETIHAMFGLEVRELVYWLTDESRPQDGNRATRKEIDRRHIAMAPADAQTIKLADLISNTSSIVERDPGFAKVYLAEKERLLRVMVKGDPQLWRKAMLTLLAGKEAITPPLPESADSGRG